MTILTCVFFVTAFAASVFGIVAEIQDNRSRFIVQANTDAVFGDSDEPWETRGGVAQENIRAIHDQQLAQGYHSEVMSELWEANQDALYDEIKRPEYYLSGLLLVPKRFDPEPFRWRAPDA